MRRARSPLCWSNWGTLALTIPSSNNTRGSFRKHQKGASLRVANAWVSHAGTPSSRAHSLQWMRLCWHAICALRSYSMLTSCFLSGCIEIVIVNQSSVHLCFRITFSSPIITPNTKCVYVLGGTQCQTLILKQPMNTIAQPLNVENVSASLCT